jgi:alpha-beta hydrolase superfamily lysophospholipase
VVDGRARGRAREARRHWGARYAAALEAARDRLIELGANDGYATFFAFGHSLRG